jgi:hypothetical protein
LEVNKKRGVTKERGQKERGQVLDREFSLDDPALPSACYLTTEETENTEDSLRRFLLALSHFAISPTSK